MQLEEILLRMAGVFGVVELLILALNPYPNTLDKWLTKKHNLLRRLAYYAACLLAAIWLATF